MPEGNRKALSEFKKECRYFFYYLSDIQKLMLDMKRIDHKMQGVHSLDFDRVGSSPTRHNRSLAKYIHINDELRKQLRERESHLLNIIDTIDRIEQPSYRPIVWMLYVQGMRLKDVAEIYDMSKDYLAQLVNEQMAALFPADGQGFEVPGAEADPEALEEEQEVITEQG